LFTVGGFHRGAITVTDHIVHENSIERDPWAVTSPQAATLIRAVAYMEDEPIYWATQFLEELKRDRSYVRYRTHDPACKLQDKTR
jgi:cell division inhibitor SulA